MRYWVCVDYRIQGPYEPEELLRLPSYSEKLMVCPENRRGNVMRDWIPAGLVSEAPSSTESPSAPQILRSPPPPPAHHLDRPAPKPSVEDLENRRLKGRVSELESTVLRLREDLAGLRNIRPDRRMEEAAGQALRDVVHQGDLQVKISELEVAVSRMREELRRKDSELAGQHSHQAETTLLRERLETAVAAQHRAESLAESHRRTIGEMSGEIKELKDHLRKLEARMAVQPTAMPPGTSKPPIPVLVPALVSRPSSTAIPWGLVLAACFIAALACAGAYLLGAGSAGKGPAPAQARVADIPQTPAVPKAMPPRAAPPRVKAAIPSSSSPTPAARKPSAQPISAAPPKGPSRAAATHKASSSKEPSDHELERLLRPEHPPNAGQKKPGDLTPEQLEKLLSQ